jgi:hypothetical protein
MAALALFVGSCTRDSAGPRPEEVEPSTGAAGQAVSVRILGRGFNPMVKASYDDPERSKIETAFRAALGSHDLENVLYVDGQTLEAAVPSTLSPGVYDLVVTDPAGREGKLEAAFTVTSPGDAGPDIAMTDGGPDAADQGLTDADGPAMDGPLTDTPRTDLPRADLPGVDAPPPVDLAFPDGLSTDVFIPLPDGFSLPDGFVCPPVCVNNCSNNVCRVDCSSGCTCPPGIPCFVFCGVGECKGNIDCSQAPACYISCVWGSCNGSITCGSGYCWVVCGPNSCQKNVDCGSSCGCSVSCLTSSACGGKVTCPSSCSSCGPGSGCDNC